MLQDNDMVILETNAGTWSRWIPDLLPRCACEEVQESLDNNLKDRIGSR